VVLSALVRQKKLPHPFQYFVLSLCDDDR